MRRRAAEPLLVAMRRGARAGRRRSRPGSGRAPWTRAGSTDEARSVRRTSTRAETPNHPGRRGKAETCAPMKPAPSRPLINRPCPPTGPAAPAAARIASCSRASSPGFGADSAPERWATKAPSARHASAAGVTAAITPRSSQRIAAFETASKAPMTSFSACSSSATCSRIAATVCGNKASNSPRCSESGRPCFPVRSVARRPRASRPIAADAPPKNGASTFSKKSA